MTTLSNYRLPLALAFAVLYNLFFWQEKLGLNLLLFSSLLMGIVLLLNPAAQQKRNVRIAAAGTLCTGLLVLLYNSGTAKVVHIGSLFLFVGFVHQPQVRTIFHALAQLLHNYLQLWRSLRDEWRRIWQLQPGFKQFFSYLKLAFIPLGVLLVFYCLFLFANARFAALSGAFWAEVGEWFTDFSWGRVFFLLSGFLLSLGLIFKRFNPKIYGDDARKNDQLVRKRLIHKGRFSFLGLKKEYRTGLLLMGMVNLLLLVINVIDVEWLWLGFEPEPGMNLRQFVHEGTYLLIASILLSMGIMLHYFRNNQHFYQPNGLLHQLSYLWIGQNVILVISVALRNYHYISAHGLAYKRIGVFFFLLLTLFGLFTLFLKIRQGKSAFYLFRVNGWAVYLVALLLCTFNWDRVITRYNLTAEYSGNLDTEFLLEMSDKNLPDLIQYHEVVMEEMKRKKDPHGATIGAMQSRYLYRLGEKMEQFADRQEHYSWLSWNWADWQTAREIEKFPLLDQTAGRRRAWD
jgi:hypothetical protein